MSAVAHFLSSVGSSVFYGPLLLLLYWCVSPALGGRLAVLMTVSGGLNELLKMITHAPRPYWTDASIRPGQAIESFGMPSGHSQNAVVLWGSLARLRNDRTAWFVAMAMAAAIGWSRHQLGVHSTAQVLAGWSVGLILLAGSIALGPSLTAWWRERPLGGQLFLSLALPLTVLCLIWAAERALHGWEMPQEWVDAVVRAGGAAPEVSLVSGALATGQLAGLLAGLSLMAARGGFDAAGSVLVRLARIPAGAVGFAVPLGLGLLLGGSVPALFAAAALAGLWAVWGAPELFVRLGLAARGGARNRAITPA